MKIRFLFIGIIILFTTCYLATTGHTKLDPDTFIGLWGFDDDGGDTARDSTENEHDGELINNPKWVEGVFGGALEFDGNAYIDLGNAESLQFDGNVSIVYWAKPDDVGAGRQNIVCKAYGGEGCITQEANGMLSFYWGDCGANCEPYVEVQRPPAGTIGSGEWIHIAVVRDVDNRQYRLYKDGVIVAQGTWNKCGAHPCGDSKPSELPLYIGTGYAGRFRGVLDEVAIIGAVIEENDIQSIMEKGFDNVAAVFAAGKLTTTWAKIKK